METKMSIAQEMNKLSSLSIYKNMDVSEKVKSKSIKQYLIILQVIEFQAFCGRNALFIDQFIFSKTVKMLEDQGFTVSSYSDDGMFHYAITW